MVEVGQVSEGKVRVSFHLIYKENVGPGDRAVPIKNNLAVFTDPEYPDCRITIAFTKISASAKQEGSCGFGLNVFADGTFLKTTNMTPKFSE
jgi:hypothetical protein